MHAGRQLFMTSTRDVFFSCTFRRKNLLYTRFLLVCIAAMLCLCAVAPVQAVSVKPPMNDAFQLSAVSSWHNRTGYYLDGSFYQDSARTQLQLYGLGVGIRKRLIGRWLRISLNGAYTQGNDDKYKRDDVPLTGTGSARTVYDIMVFDEYHHVWASAGLQYVFDAQGTNIHPFLHAGLAGHVVNIHEWGRVDDNSSLDGERISISPAFQNTNARVSVHTGAGIDLTVALDWGLSIAYIHRYWQPVSYTYTEAMPLDGIAYHEWYRTHTLRVSVVWRTTPLGNKR
jgi:hypothetical protein